MRHGQDTAIEASMEQLIANGSEDMGVVFASLFDLAMRIERERFLGAEHYERTSRRRGYANGTKPKRLDTPAGTLTVSCRKFRNKEGRLQLHALACNLANFMRTLALPAEVEHWSLTTLREKLVKIGAEVVRHGRYVTFHLAEVSVPRKLFQKILELINDLRRRPGPA
jgi:hypothetical protein